MENLFLSDVSVLCGGGAATVRINREEKLNALNSGVLDQLCYVFREIGKARDIRVAVLTGAGGRAFAAGADLAEIAELGNIEALREYYRQFNILYSIMGEIPQPIVARVNGWAFGGGCLLALAAELVIATDKSSFSQPEVNFGFTGGAALLPRLVGRHRAAEITMLGRPFTAEEACRMGLVNRVVEEEELDGEVAKFTGQLLKKDVLALSMIKRVIRSSYEKGLSGACRYEDECSAICLGRPESREAILRFLNKKP